MSGGEGGEFGDRLRVAALLQVHVEAGLEQAEAPFLQAGALGLGVRAGDVGERLAVPQGQRPVDQFACLAQVPGAAGLLRVGAQRLRRGQVERVAAQGADRVAAGLADEDAGVKDLAQPGGVRTDGGEGL